MNYLVTYETMEDDIGLICEDDVVISVDPNKGDVLGLIKKELLHICSQAVVVSYEQEDEDIISDAYFC